MKAPSVSCRGLSVSFASLAVINSISFDIAAGEIVALIGASGSGKSTLLRVIAGLQRPTGGSVEVFGAEVTGPTNHVRYLFQDYDSYPWLSVRSNIALAADRPSEARISELLQEVGLKQFADTMPHNLSGGMRKRLGLARSLAAQARLVLLDEPFASLDVKARSELYSLLHRVNRQFDCGFIIVTHDVDEAVFLSHRIIVASARPLTVREIVSAEKFTFPRSPSLRMDPQFEGTVDRVRSLLNE